MPRKRLRTTNNRSYSVADLRQACEEVLTHGRTTRSVALQFKIPRITLKRHSSQREHRGRSKTSRRKSTKKTKRTNKKKEAVKRRILEDSSSDDDSVIYEESSDSLEEFDAYDDSPQAVTKGDFVIVKVYGQNKLNVGEIIHAVNDGFEVQEIAPIKVSFEEKIMGGQEEPDQTLTYREHKISSGGDNSKSEANIKNTSRKPEIRKDHFRNDRYLMKKDFCYICKIDVIDFMTHLKNNHQEDDDVRIIFAYQPNTTLSNILIQRLKEKWNSLKNNSNHTNDFPVNHDSNGNSTIDCSATDKPGLQLVEDRKISKSCMLCKGASETGTENKNEELVKSNRVAENYIPMIKRKNMFNISKSNRRVKSAYHEFNTLNSNESEFKKSRKNSSVIVKQYCLFCKTDVRDFLRHLWVNHRRFNTVRQIFKFPVHSKSREILVNRLKEKWNSL
ncbi:unnamed protein product [Acanthoscelides obtectus]|uniref:Uncharacterized protein n=1 Tax=Acanthoscelides obtectus TaxID=200917 RepID=A0A9P0PEL5_ACAOB|nr:unnamed protein product [Acanthoscelides obtectus]CAK1675804.1 hypothetical protein AOBTE_LOCUS30431 [Acanthoscelides obtectus]